jgi:D-alanyl-D-alanine carboxypeptidase/D-alanyl-D-alanine-endopeptidase (penicillin-binding protein 4)
MATASAALTPPTLANESRPVAAIDYFQGRESIEIQVPPPENFNQGVCQQALSPTIQGIMGQYSKHWGIQVESLETGQVFYSHNADKFFIPASNTKLFTTAAALQRLNPDGTIRSKTVREWINVTNQRSNNWYADTLLSYIGGAGVAKSSLAQIGINPNDYRLADGSGLSRHNVAKPRAIIQLLRAMYYSPSKDLFYSSLPVAGHTGTLRNRMKHTTAQGAVSAKTGTLRGVRALSGYLNHPQHGIILFSILVNNPYQSGNSLVSSIDRMVLQLSTFSACESQPSF